MAVLNGQNIKKHEGRDDLAGEYKYGDAGQLILFVLFIVALLIDLIFLHVFSEIRSAISWYIRIPVSIPFIVFPFLLFQFSHKEIFHNHREQLKVVSTGVYSLIRHPMYLATILLLFSVLVLSLSVLAFVIWIVFLIFYIFIARFEEKLLIEKLGSEYEEYMQSVPMFIPRLWKK